MPQVIGLVGSLNSGKTSCMRMLESELKNTRCHNFAHPLKEWALAVGFKWKEVYGTQAEKEKPNVFWGVSGRKFCQVIGDLMRVGVPGLPEMSNLWVRLLEKKVQEGPPETTWIVGDGRFPAEADCIRSLGGSIVRVRRPVAASYDRTTTTDEEKARIDNHVSETSHHAIRACHTIDNDGTLDDLREACRDFCRSWVDEKKDTKEEEAGK